MSTGALQSCKRLKIAAVNISKLTFQFFRPSAQFPLLPRLARSMASSATESSTAQTSGIDSLNRPEADSDVHQRARRAPSPRQTTLDEWVGTPRNRNFATRLLSKVNRTNASIAGAIVAVACAMIAWIVWAYKHDKLSWERYGDDVSMITKMLIMTFGSARLLSVGTGLIVSHLSHHHPGRVGDLEQEKIIDWVSLIAVILAPSWASLAMLPGMSVGRCRDELNPYVHLPVKTSVDLRHVLEVWWKFVSLYGKFILGTAQSFKHIWRFSPRNLAVLAVCLAGWSLLEMFKGPCWVNTRVFWSWFPGLVAVSLWYIVDKSDDLLVKPRLFPCANLLMFTVVLYTLWTTPLDLYCNHNKCW